MARRAMAAALALAAGLMTVAGPVLAQDGRIKVLHGNAPDTAVSVSRNEGGTGITVVRGSSSFVPAKAAAAQPVVHIDGEAVRIDALEPTGNWFIDRSEGRLVVVHCYTRQAVLVGGGRRILCDARKL